MSWIGVAKNIVNVLDAVKGLVDIVASGASFLKALIPHDRLWKTWVGVADSIAGIASSGAAVGSNIADGVYYDNASRAIDKYSNEQAHQICLQDYGLQAHMCE